MFRKVEDDDDWGGKEEGWEYHTIKEKGGGGRGCEEANTFMLRLREVVLHTAACLLRLEHERNFCEHFYVSTCFILLFKMSS